MVQDLTNAKGLSFKENDPNVGNNTLPSHGSPTVNAIEEIKEWPLIIKGENACTPFRVVYIELCRFGIIEKKYEEKDSYSIHPNCKHCIQECREFKKIL